MTRSAEEEADAGDGAVGPGVGTASIVRAVDWHQRARPCGGEAPAGRVPGRQTLGVGAPAVTSTSREADPHDRTLRGRAQAGRAGAWQVLTALRGDRAMRDTRRVVVTRDQLEAGMARARALAPADPRAGIHGPDSLAWEWGREAINFLGAGRAALLQLAHPPVAHAIDQHSATRSDARGRFERTFQSVFAMAFGDLDHAFHAARRVFAVHKRVHGTIGEDTGRVWRAGTPYAAADPESLLWVHTTLVDSVLVVRDAVFGDVDDYRAEQYVRETRRFAFLFGIPEEMVPGDLRAFRAYRDRMVASDQVVVGRPAREIGRFLLAAPTPAARPLMEWYRVMTAGLLPEKLRAGYGFRFGALDRALYRSSLRGLGRTARALPRPLRYFPQYLEAESRMGMGPRRQLASRVAERLALTGIGLWGRAG